MCRVFFIPPMLPYLDGNISHITWTLPNLPLQRSQAVQVEDAGSDRACLDARMWSPQGHRVESGRRLGGWLAAERQGVDGQ
jgi:hypothetical protein